MAGADRGLAQSFQIYRKTQRGDTCRYPESREGDLHRGQPYCGGHRTSRNRGGKVTMTKRILSTLLFTTLVASSIGFAQDKPVASYKDIKYPPLRSMKVP